MKIIKLAIISIILIIIAIVALQLFCTPRTEAKAMRTKMRLKTIYCVIIKLEQKAGVGIIEQLNKYKTDVPLIKRWESILKDNDMYSDDSVMDVYGNNFCLDYKDNVIQRNTCPGIKKNGASTNKIL